MKLNQALKRVGASIAQEKINDKSATIYLRVDPDQGEKWVETVTEFLIGAEGKAFTADVSKYFFAQHGGVKYLWRIVIEGAVDAALGLLGAAAMQVSVAHAPEIKSMPLIGRVEYPFDPARGKIKGAHQGPGETDGAPMALAMAVSGVPGGVR